MNKIFAYEFIHLKRLIFWLIAIIGCKIPVNKSFENQ